MIPLLLLFRWFTVLLLPVPDTPILVEADNPIR